MRVRRILFALLTLGLLLGFVSPVSFALSPVEVNKNKGLYIAPLRNYLAANAGDSLTRAFTVANRTDQPMTITTSLEEFSVTNYTYDYRFNKIDNNWLQIIEKSFTLKPYESREVPYKITLPKTASPGGYYYTLYASSTTQTGATTSTVRAASLLYLTVNGNLTRTSQVIDRSLPWIVTSPQINYSLNIKNTGNVHYFGYFESAVRGLTYRDAPNGSSQLLMPGTIRHIENSIRSPLLPGIYRLDFSYVPDQGRTTPGTQYFLYLPPWSIALLALLIALSIHFIRQQRRYRTQKAQSSNE